MEMWGDVGRFHLWLCGEGLWRGEDLDPHLELALGRERGGRPEVAALDGLRSEAIQSDKQQSAAIGREGGARRAAALFGDEGR